MSVRVLLIVVSVASLGFAPAPLPRKQRPCEDPTDVAGTWEFVLAERRGVRRSSLEKEYRVEITRRRFALVVQGAVETEFVMSLDPAVSPPAFTWTTGRRVEFVGSYLLQKDRLTLIFDAGDRLVDRPVDFGGRAGWRFVLRRVRR